MLPSGRDTKFILILVAAWVVAVCNAVPTDDLNLLRRGKRVALIARPLDCLRGV